MWRPLQKIEEKGHWSVARLRAPNLSPKGIGLSQIGRVTVTSDIGQTAIKFGMFLEAPIKPAARWFSSELTLRRLIGGVTLLIQVG